MKETIYQVAGSIYEALPEYNRKHIPVVARVHGSFDGSVDTYWFLVGSMNQSMITMPELKMYGRLVPRNSFVANKILNSELGTDINYTLRNNIKRLVDHHIKATSKGDLENHEISIWGDSQKYTYGNLSEFLRGLKTKQVEIEQNEERQRQLEEQRQKEKDAHERGVLTKKLNKLEEERRVLTMQQEEMKQLTRFIRKQGQLRFNPILDPIQNRIKTRNLFDDKVIVIDGGPGTGKTTTMIQRLKYLTDQYAIEEDFTNETELFKLSATQRDHLLDAIRTHKDWIFFSPSELLKEYLSDAMNREGLTNTNAKVWSWDEYRNKIIRENYLFIDPTNDNAPFKQARSNEVLFKNDISVIDSFTSFFLENLHQIRNRFPKVDFSDKQYRWASIARNIQQRFDESEGFSLAQFVHLFHSLEHVYSEDCRELLTENKNKVNIVATELLLICKDHDEVFNKLVEMTDTRNTEQIEEIDDESDTGEVVELEAEDIDNRIISMIRIWFKRYCYSQINTDIRLTARQTQLSEILTPHLRDEHKAQMERIGELALFEQYAKYTRGIRSNLFGGFAGKYKRFRRQMFAAKDNHWNLVELESLINRREGKGLHPQEQSLLIGFINNLVKMVYRVTKDPVNHTFVRAYNELTRPIIGIDEATDFCECDIYAMQSLLYHDYNSLTLCGDLMQRLTTKGITSWEPLRLILPNMDIVEMRTSYRQSSKLVKIAQKLYKDTIGEEPQYKAYMKSQKVPSPLSIISDNEEEKVEWIEKRIREVYLAYGKKLPSIAIFLNHKSDIRPFVDALRDTDFVYDSAIEVVDGSEGNVLASSNQIRVYPIDKVKGMEFDVVFFHNIDDANVDSDLIKRYIYVGVSRAAFFLGVTLNFDNKDLTKYFEKGADWAKI